MGMFDLTGNVALVTGSSRGLGRAIAHGLGQAGARVVLNSRHRDGLQEARAAFAADGIEAAVCPFDVSDEDAVEEGVAAIERDVGPIDVLVNNAGTNLRGPLEQFESERWRRVMAVNLDGVFHTSRAVGRRMLRRGRGRIINICSLLSEGGRAGIAPYAASKGGVKMLTKCLATEWGPRGVRVNGIGPGYFVTEMTRPLKEDPEADRWVCARTPMGRWGEPRELVGAAVFLASEASAFVNGQIIYVDGGFLAAL